jgi:ribonucleoside-diphosphate reductase alpha chain
LPLEGLLVFARNLILNKQGSHLSDIDVHDLCCMAGKIVQVGGVRRASCISLSDLYSHSMRHAKSGNWWEKAKWRSMANNSSVFEERPSAVDFMEEWLALAQSGSGERGLFNRQGVNRSIPKRRKKWKFIVNPCAEIILRAGSKPDGTGGGGQMCNLSLAIARPNDTIDSLRRKIKLATYFGVLQSLCTNFKYIRKEFVHNCNEERLIGVDITGHADCSLLRYGAENRSCLLSLLREDVATTRSELAKRFGINESAADTCVKPSGDSSVLFSCASGISPRFSKYQIRWVRESVNSPMTALLKAEGVPWAVAPEDDSLVVFGFPIKAPEGCTLRNDLTAIQQLENWLDWKENWAEHSVSCTIYVEPHEWLEVGNWVYTHFDAISGISFLPKDNGNYKFSPNEELTEDEYRKMVEAFPKIHWAKLQYYEIGDHTVSTQTPACSGDRCEI